MAQGYNAMAEFDAFAPNAAFSGMVAGAAITLLASLGPNVIATVLGLAAMTFTGASSLIGVVLSAALFYFLWNERQKFSES